MARVLSVQSHVAYGYVGGKAAVFPLQLLGYDVDVVNTVNFSNHSGYARAGGTKTSAKELNMIFNIMELNELLKQDRLLTGYIPSSEPLAAIADVVRRLKLKNPNLVYLLDPVMGDAGCLYVAPDVIPIYRSMLPLATIITPNWFEVETLTQVPLVDFPSIRRALKILHTEYKVPNVVISSIPLYSWLLVVLPPTIRPSESTVPPHLLCIASAADIGNQDGNSRVSARAIPQIPGYFSGVGDLFSALLLGHYRSSRTEAGHEEIKGNGINGFGNGHIATPMSDYGALTSATTLALSTTHAVLSFTHKRTLGLPELERLPTDDEADASEPLRRTRRMRGRELALIQAQHILTRTDEPRFELVPWGDFWA
ncbi:hypothetical protein M378DRAFT_184375 [Amanita muscaria Koide BX008]|uniref:pyridoxal kinase n=1 Tax=Amanita muscaria (strain Koide BX008) TaxID=946122 RepID=A0A0C2X499_AMAMK|nr:hypothetical protein M378DRAFT_184375 [Amanita muscaria Koide BX008]